MEIRGMSFSTRQYGGNEADIDNIKKARLSIMGISALWIMIFHGTISTNINLINFFIETGYLGVDIFMFMSGFSMYFSYKNTCKGNAKVFYKKRLIKILPTFIPFAIFWLVDYLLSNYDSFSALFSAMHKLVFWLIIFSSRWFVPCILLCYLLTPLIEKSFNRLEYKRIALFLAVVGFILLSFLFLGSSSALIILLRIPEFIIGYYYASDEDRRSNIFFRIIIVVLQFVVLYMLLAYLSSDYLFDSGLYWYPAIFAVSSMVLCLSKMKSKKVKILSFLGKYSLEIYLWHVCVLDLLKDIFINRNIEFDKYNIVINVLSIVFTCMVSYVYAFIIKSLLKLMRKKSI